MSIAPINAVGLQNRERAPLKSPINVPKTDKTTLRKQQPMNLSSLAPNEPAAPEKKGFLGGLFKGKK
jgi:hypothetical protein